VEWRNRWGEVEDAEVICCGSRWDEPGGRRRRSTQTGIGVTLLAKKDVLYLDRLRLPHRMFDWLVVCASAFKEAMWY